MEQGGKHDGGKGRFFSSRVNIALIGFLVIAGFFLITEHRAHFLGALPFLLILACPLLHLFMHRGGHGGHGAASKPAADEARGPQVPHH